MKNMFVCCMFFIETLCTFSCKTFDKSIDSSHKNAEKIDGVENIIGEDVSCRILIEDYYSSFPYAQGTYVARSFKDVLAISEGNESIINLCEKIDFDREALIFVFAGRFNTGGYSIIVDSAKKTRKGEIYVKFSVSFPKTGDIVTQAFTNPYMIVAVEAKKRDVIHSQLE